MILRRLGDLDRDLDLTGDRDLDREADLKINSRYETQNRELNSK